MNISSWVSNLAWDLHFHLLFSSTHYYISLLSCMTLNSLPLSLVLPCGSFSLVLSQSFHLSSRVYHLTSLQFFILYPYFSRFDIIFLFRYAQFSRFVTRFVFIFIISRCVPVSICELLSLFFGFSPIFVCFIISMQFVQSFPVSNKILLFIAARCWWLIIYTVKFRCHQ